MTDKEDAENIIEGLIESLGLEGLEAECFGIFLRDPHGFEIRGAASILAGPTGHKTEDCLEAISGLQDKNYVLIREQRYQVNFEELNIDEADRVKLHDSFSPYECLGSPHSAWAMQSFRDWFASTKGTIYVAMGVTSHKILEEALQARADKNRFSILVFPSKKQFAESSHQHYDEILSQWKTFLSDADGNLRKNSRFLISGRLTRTLHTSGLDEHKSRFNIHWLSQSTRLGEMIVTPCKTSLYQLVYNEYQSATYFGKPLFSIWPKAWILKTLNHWTSALVGFALLMSAAILFSFRETWDYINLLVSAMIPLGLSFIIHRVLPQAWTYPELFKKG